MPLGTVVSLVHLSCQSSRAQGAALVPGRNTIGYGYVLDAGERLYFDAGAVAGTFEDLYVGQQVDFTRDREFPSVSRLAPANVSIAAEPARVSPASPPSPPPDKPTQNGAAGSAKAIPGAAAKPARKPAEEPPTLVLTDKQQCLLVFRYRRDVRGNWMRARGQPEVETYTGPIAEQFREPRFVQISPSFCAVRLYAADAIDLRRPATPLGDYAAAEAVSDAVFAAHIPDARLKDSW